MTENVLRNERYNEAAAREDEADDGQGREPEAIAIAHVRQTLGGEQCLNQVSRWKTISISVIYSILKETTTEKIHIIHHTESERQTMHQP